MTATFIGVRHHSPACARLVRDTIRATRPAHVLVEGPADMNDRLGEVLLDHDLPVAIFTSYRDDERHHVSWSPLCGHSPEWVALTEGRAVGAEVRFVDLPAWHPAFELRANRYSDAERRHHDAIERLCATLAVDNVDTLWDHLFEVDVDDRLEANLAAYFDVLRGDAETSEADAAREAYMAEWVQAAVADAGGRPVVVVTGGFHRPALVQLAGRRATTRSASGWPEIPRFPDGAVGGSYLVPFSFKRLDAFDGYQSGMPSPRYYQRLWEAGPAAAGEEIVHAVVQRLRARRQPVSTADLIAARALATGLARLRGHGSPSRTDVLDGLVSALVTDALDRPLPWTGRGQLVPGTDPVVVEMVAALSGDVVGRLHPDTPLPPLVASVEAELRRCGLDRRGRVDLDLTDEADLDRSRVLHRIGALAIPGYEQEAGPVAGGAPALAESWVLRPSDHQLPATIEAGSYGPTLESAAAAALSDAFALVGPDPNGMADVLFQAALCGLGDLAVHVLEQAAALVGGISELPGVGVLLATTLGLWRHDRLLGLAGSPALATVVDASATRALWLIEGIRGAGAPADDGRLRAIVAVRDAIVHAGDVLRVPRDAALSVFQRSRGADRPPDLRGASVGIALAFADDGRGTAEVEAAVRTAASPSSLGDFLAGLFATAREHLLLAGDEGEHGVLGVLDLVLGRMDDDEFLVALPSLRLAFSWFPPREREAIADDLLARRGLRGAGRSLLRLGADPSTVAHGRAVEARVDDLLQREALLSGG